MTPDQITVKFTVPDLALLHRGLRCVSTMDPASRAQCEAVLQQLEASLAEHYERKRNHN